MSRAHRFAVWLGMLLTSSACAGASTSAAPAPASSSASTPPSSSELPHIEWASWSPEAFARAASENKLILLDVGIEGCTACRWMYEDTYEDPAVIARVTEHFVAISVDADVEPDLGEVYGPWGWPATIFMAPDGTHVLKVRGNKRPHNFLPILDGLVAMHDDGTLMERAAPLVAEIVQPPPADDSDKACRLTVRRLDRKREPLGPGWGFGHKEVRGAATSHAVLRGHARGDEERLDHLVATAAAYEKLLDPEWGGTFVGSRTADFGSPIPEKRSAWTITAMTTFADAYRLTGERRWKDDVAEVHRYLRDFMRAPDGRFYATQEDLAPKWPSERTREAYFELPDAQRRRYGVPPIDHGIYTDINAAVIEGYARAFEATGDEVYLRAATTAAARILEQAARPGGGLRQADAGPAVGADARMRGFAPDDERLFLRPQATFGRALLALYRVTGDETWRAAAVGLADVMLRELSAEEGGFLASDRDELVSTGSPRKPLIANAIAAHFLLALAAYEHDETYATAAERALLAVAGPKATSRMGALELSEFALAWEWWALGPVEISVVGDPEDAAARALFDAAREVFEPRKVLHFETGDRYPRKSYPTLYVCTSDACSSPIRDPARVAETVAAFARVQGGAKCTLPPWPSTP